MRTQPEPTTTTGAARLVLLPSHKLTNQTQTTHHNYTNKTTMKSLLFACTLLLSAEGFIPQMHRPATKTALLAQPQGSNANEINPMTPGSTCALVTPYTASGKIDVPALRNLLRFHVENGTDGLCILGTTGEAAVMSMEERATVLTTAVEEVKGKIPILAGTGTIDPVHVKEMTLQAIDIGCDASLVVTPYYVKPPQRGLVKHFLDMADLGLPVVIYNIPGRAQVDFVPESIALVADHPNIIGVKEATGDVGRVDQLRELTGDKLLLLSGDDRTDAEFVLHGGDGCISVTANVAPKQKHNLMMAALRGNKDEIAEINSKLDPVTSALFIEPSPMPCKYALKKMGMIEHSFARPPLDDLDPKYYDDVEIALRGAGILEDIYTEDAVLLGTFQ